MGKSPKVSLGRRGKTAIHKSGGLAAEVKAEAENCLG